MSKIIIAAILGLAVTASAVAFSISGSLGNPSQTSQTEVTEVNPDKMTRRQIVEAGRAIPTITPNTVEEEKMMLPRCRKMVEENGQMMSQIGSSFTTSHQWLRRWHYSLYLTVACCRNVNDPHAREYVRAMDKLVEAFEGKAGKGAYNMYGLPE